MQVSSPSSQPSPTQRILAWQGWRGVIVAGVILAVSVPMLLIFQQKNEPRFATVPDTFALPPNHLDQVHMPLHTRHYPAPMMQDLPLSKVAYEEDQSGRRILRIQAVQDGDLMVVDVNTGRLLEVRDSSGRPVWIARPTTEPDSTVQVNEL